MWIIIAAMCTSDKAADCFPMIWNEKSFITEQQCKDRLDFVQNLLPPDVVFSAARCVAVPGQVNS